jgi:GH43 family beta-xylosidase
MKKPLLTVAITLLLQPIIMTDLNLIYSQENPVLEKVADAGVINFNGKYYIAGVFTNGGFYISDDLVHWKGPVHVFSMDNQWTKGRSATDNNIHAADIHYWNGVFHFYWSVNYWGLRDMTVHIGHATSDKILGPYTEPDRKKWFDDRIDAELFIDDDSSFYFYTVKFTDGNTIWGQRMSDPSHLTGEPELIYTAFPNTWEQFDNKVIEGPWVIKYRSRYYMMYNANHTSSQYGNYALGVAESNSPMGFNGGNKYANPVVTSSLTDDPDKFRYYFSGSDSLFKGWKYTFSQPDQNWMDQAFDDSAWSTGEKGFGSQEVRGSSVIHRQTAWTSQEIWLRKEFSLLPAPGSELQLLVNHSGPAEVFIDGVKIYSDENSNYRTISLNTEIINKLRAGKNLIAVHGTRSRRSSFLDVELVDPLTKPGDDILYNPGQPNILRGPNGLEWWLIYFGIKNGGNRSQFISRVLFHDHELTVDGPNGSRTYGYHPDPSLPQFGDVFDYQGTDTLQKKWSLKSGKWSVRNHELSQMDSVSKARVLIKCHSSSNFFFKSGVKSDSFKKGKAGILAWYADAANYLEIGLDKPAGSWYYNMVNSGKAVVSRIKLSGNFNFDAYHSLSVFKNSNKFEVFIDDHPAPGTHLINSSFAGNGIPGLFTENCKASFDGVIYTCGFDEYDNGISGWKDSYEGAKMNGKWEISNAGIAQKTSVGKYSVFKGDMLNRYEFGVQLFADYKKDGNNKGITGIYPVYFDSSNYLSVSVDYKSGNLVISGKNGGRIIAEKIIPLKKRLCKYPDPKYGDSFMKVYPLKENTEISALEIVKSIYNYRDFSINTFDSLKIFYRQNGEWHPLDFSIVSRDNQAVNRVEFDKVTADAFKLISSANDNSVNVYKLYVTEEQTSDYNLRCVKLDGRVIVFLDGRQIAEVKESWGVSQVGLFCSDMASRFNGITLFEKEPENLLR